MEAYLPLGALITLAVIFLLLLKSGWFKKKTSSHPDNHSFYEKNLLSNQAVLEEETGPFIYPRETRAINNFSGLNRSTVVIPEKEEIFEEVPAFPYEGRTPVPAVFEEESHFCGIEDRNKLDTQSLHDTREFEAEPFPNRPIHNASPSSIDSGQSNNVQATQPSGHDLVIITVAAKPGGHFASYELLQAIAATGMKYGNMNIFHYYYTTDTRKITLFSLASATEPGEFDLNNMGDFSCKGLSLFMSLSQVPNAEDAFALMHETALQLADDLNGELRAGPHIPWNEEVMRHYQNKVSQYSYHPQATIS